MTIFRQIWRFFWRFFVRNRQNWLFFCLFFLLFFIRNGQIWPFFWPFLWPFSVTYDGFSDGFSPFSMRNPLAMIFRFCVWLQVRDLFCFLPNFWSHFLWVLKEKQAIFVLQILFLHIFFHNWVPIYKLICIFAAASARLATMSSEDDGADGWSTTYWKALLTLCFWSFWNYHFPNHGQEQCRGNPTECSIYSP